jgi:hypothetical protein
MQGHGPRGGQKAGVTPSAPTKAAESRRDLKAAGHEDAEMNAMQPEEKVAESHDALAPNEQQAKLLLPASADSKS